MKKITAADAAMVMITFLNSANNYKKEKQIIFRRY